MDKVFFMIALNNFDAKMIIWIGKYARDVNYW